MKKLILLLSLVIPMMLGAQQWEKELENNAVISGGLINESGTAILVGYEYDGEVYHAAAFKINENGESATFSFNKEYEDIRFHNIIQLPNGNYFVSGYEVIGKIGNNYICNIHVVIMDAALNVINHESFSAEESFSFGYHHDILVDECNVIMVCETFGDNLGWGRKPSFLKFDIDGKLQKCIYPEKIAGEDGSYEYNHIDFARNQLKKRPDGSGYVVIAKFTSTGMHLMMYDKDFNFEDNVRIEHPENNPYYDSPLYSDYSVSSDLWLSDDDMMLFGSSRDTRTDDGEIDYEVIISSVNIDGTVNGYEVISSDSCHSAFQGNGCMRYVNDSTIYGGYYSSAHHVIEPFYPQICLFTKDMEILGRVTITEGCSMGQNYMLAYDDGDILYISSMKHADTYKTITKRYSRNDFINATMDVKEVPAEEIGSLVYPNPTEGELNIDIRGIGSDIENRVRIMDLSGRTMMSRIIRGSGNVLRLDVGALDSGVYFYEIFNAGGTVTKGKFVRE